MDLGNGALPPQRRTADAAKRAKRHKRAMRRAFKGVMPRREAERLFYAALLGRIGGRS